MMSGKPLVEGVSPNVRLSAVGHRHEPVRFWGQKVKGQGHDKTKYCQNHLFKTSVWWRHTSWQFSSKTMQF